MISKSGSLENGFAVDKNAELLNMKIADYELTTDDRSEARLTRSVLNELTQRFKPYVAQSTIASIFTNGSFYKVYLTNKLTTYQFSKRTDDASKGVLSIVDAKVGYDVWPIAPNKEDIPSLDVLNYRKIEE